MVRSTVYSVTQNTQNQIAAQYTAMAKIQEQLSTGKQLNRPSDNPVDVANDLTLKTASSILTQNGKNIADGLNFMQVSDTAMQSMNTVIQRTRELAIQGSSDTLSASDRVDMQQETDQLFRQLISLADTNYNGTYVFGGTQSNMPPFPIDSSVASSASDYQNLKMAYFNGAAAGVGQPAQLRNAFDNSAMTNILPGSLKISNGATNYVEGTDYTVDYVNGTITPVNPALAVDISDGGAFNGPNYKAGGFSITFDSVGKSKDLFGNTVANTGDVKREIEQGVTIPINISGEELTTNQKTGTNMMTTMIQFGQSLLQNNTQGVSNAIDNIDSVSQALLSAQSKNGARMNMFTTTQTRNQQQSTQNTSQQSSLEDVDMATAATNFSEAEMVYNAALKAGSMIIQPTLATYL